MFTAPTQLSALTIANALAVVARLAARTDRHLGIAPVRPTLIGASLVPGVVQYAESGIDHGAHSAAEMFPQHRGRTAAQGG
ncbi:hypothetical protein LV457_02745 [Mycobacterium sp. MYCO198283]|uniref:hypothetical protein n=1 Tax=Mycobacterium sp. MYCO198283 TaxID=2883505 RepID=UPI001E343CA8|nr:hypothetical protein [Mycobacterium sp. MYCO198283]MCG5431208.1 hypothetical protein [Mycobacterium sp. MYCO198283]